MSSIVFVSISHKCSSESDGEDCTPAGGSGTGGSAAGSSSRLDSASKEGNDDDDEDDEDNQTLAAIKERHLNRQRSSGSQSSRPSTAESVDTSLTGTSLNDLRFST